MADEQQPSDAMRNYEEKVANAPSALEQSPAAQPEKQQAQPTAQPAKEAPQTGPGWKQKLAEKWARLKEFYAECVRVLKVTKKPSREELKTVVKVSGIGILLIGLIGFIIHLAKELLL